MIYCRRSVDRDNIDGDLIRGIRRNNSFQLNDPNYGYEIRKRSTAPEAV